QGEQQVAGRGLAMADAGSQLGRLGDKLDATRGVEDLARGRGRASRPGGAADLALHGKEIAPVTLAQAVGKTIAGFQQGAQQMVDADEIRALVGAQRRRFFQYFANLW